MINNVIKYINGRGRFHSSNELIENSFWFLFSSFISLINPFIKYKDKEIPVNYFGISIARSGSGKSFVYQKTKELFDIQRWEKAIEVSYNLANKELPDDNISIDGEKYNVKNFLPSFENTIEGTKEGLYLRALAISKSFAGSLNIINEEIMDIIMASNMNSMKELYDGIFLGKIIKSNMNKNIYGIRTNMLLFGSSTGLKKDSKVYEYFQKALNSGIYRRSFIYYEEPQKLSINCLNDNVDKLNLSYINNMIKDNANSYQKGFPTFIEVSNEADKLLAIINNELIEFSNQYLDDERFSAEIGSFDKILKLAGLHAILNMRYKIDERDVGYAYDLYKRFRETNKTLFNVEPQHKRIYKIIKSLGKCTKTDILERDIFNRLSFNEDLALIEEYCYKNNEQLCVTGSKIKFYEIKSLDRTSLGKIIVSIPAVDNNERTTNYRSMTIPMFGENSIQKLVMSSKVSNFCLVHFEQGKRSKNNVIPKINCIGIDVDTGSLSETIKKLNDSNIVYIIYTTKSHQKEKNGFISDRFRIILPLSNVIDIEPDRYSAFIQNICSSFNIETYDTNALDMSRLWFTNQEAEVFTNTSGSIFNPLPYLPETEMDNEITKMVELSGDDDEIIRRINGMIRWTISNSVQGYRNNNLAKLAFFVYDLTGNKELAKSVVLSTNKMLTEPLNEIEIYKTIFISLERK